jgi:hypothetical protein
MRASVTGRPRGKWRRYAPWIAALVAVVLLSGAAGAYFATRPTGLASAAVPKAPLPGSVKIIGGQDLKVYAKLAVGVQPPTGLLQSLGPVWHVGPDGLCRAKTYS